MPNKIGFFTEAMKMSLENADQWIKDAKLLMENSSFGHADVSLRIANEELAKTYVCWLTSERMLPIDNQIVKDVFKYHSDKIELVIGMILSDLTVKSNRPQKVKPPIEPLTERLKRSEKKAILDNTQIGSMINSINERRQKAMYVHWDRKTNELTSPLNITEEEAKKSLETTEALLKTVRRCIEVYSEEDKEAWREFFRTTGIWDNA